MEIIKAGTTVAESRENDNARAGVRDNAALIDYVAMMADIELPIEEGGDANERMVPED